MCPQMEKRGTCRVCDDAWLLCTAGWLCHAAKVDRLEQLRKSDDGRMQRRLGIDEKVKVASGGCWRAHAEDRQTCIAARIRAWPWGVCVGVVWCRWPRACARACSRHRRCGR